MSPERWKEIERLYQSAVELPPDQRTQFLTESCSDDELRREVESLLAQRNAPSFMERRGLDVARDMLSRNPTGNPLTGGVVSSTAEQPAPSNVGRYRIIRLIGEGGMGSVYEAEQENPRRTVALKMIRPGRATPESLLRFEQEAQALGRLQHPGIAQIYDAGTADTGFGTQPYLAMEFIHGKNVKEYAEERQLTTRQRLEMVAKIAEAIHHAHQRGIIHRDLKPSNILVDESGQPKVLDFGVARLTDTDAEATFKTHLGVLVGTLAYMSPEQVLADPLEIDTRSDTYSLGIILYELLAGRLPYPITGRLDEIVHTIRENDPPLLGLVNRIYRGDIETIVAKALEKDKASRYASASEFAADITRHLDDEPVVAVRPTRLYRLRKFVRKNRLPVTAVTAILLSLLIGFVISVSLYFRVRAARDEAEWQNYVDNLSAADSSIRVGEVREARRLLDLCPPRFRGWEWFYRSFETDSSLARLGPEPDDVRAVGFVHNGEQIVVQMRQKLHMYSVATRKSIAMLEPLSGGGYSINESILAFSGDGQRILSSLPSASDRPQVVNVRDSATGRVLATFNAPFIVAAAGFSPDGTRLVVGNGLRPQANSKLHYPAGSFGSLMQQDPGYVWDVDSGELRLTLRSDIGPFEESPNSKRPVQRNSLFSRPFPTAFVSQIAFTENGQQIVSGWSDVIRMWDAVSGALIQTIMTNDGGVKSVAVTEDGTTIASGSTGGTVRIWDSFSGELIRTFWGHEGTVNAVAFGSNGTIASGSVDGTVRVWREMSPEGTTFHGHESSVTSVAFSPAGNLLASGSLDRTVRLWRPDSSPFSEVGGGSENFIASATFRPDGQAIAGATSKGIIVWDRHLKVIRTLSDQRGLPVSMAFSPDGSLLVSQCEKTICLWRLKSEREPVTIFSGHDDQVMAVAVTKDSLRVVSGSRDRSIRIWSATTGTLLKTLYGHQAAVTTIAISPDGKLIASGSEDTSIKLWDSLSGNLIRTLAGSGARVTSLNFGSEGQLVSSAGDAIRIWDTKSGKNVAVLRGHEAEVTSVAWHPNGKRIISGSSDGTVRLWDADRLASPFMLRTSSAIEAVAFSPSGNEIIATTSVVLTGGKSVTSSGNEGPRTTEPGRMLVWRASPPAP